MTTTVTKRVSQPAAGGETKRVTGAPALNTTIRADVPDWLLVEYASGHVEPLQLESGSDYLELE